VLTVSIQSQTATDQRYGSGGRVSNTQWSVVGIIGGSSARLDPDYLRQWARTLGPTDRLDQAFKLATNEDRGRSSK